MTSLRRALKASLNLEGNQPSLAPSNRGSGGRSTSLGDESSTSGRQQRRYTDGMLGDRHGFSSGERNRTASGSSTRAHGRRAHSDGDGDGDSSEEAESANSDESDSDVSVTITGRGRSSVPDRRIGSGSVVKREKQEPVPVSPPRQNVIGAAHEAEEGSQVKVKFDSGHWYGGTVVEVDSQRGIIVIDYDDGTQEVSGIPDSDVVIYPWRPPELRVPPRPLAQMLREEQERGRDGKSAGHNTNSRPKLQVKSEPPSSPSPRRKRVKSRDNRRREDHGRGRGGGQGSGGEGRRNGRGSRAGGVGKAGSSPSSYDEGGEEESEEDDEEGWDEGPGDGERDRSREGRGAKDRWQQQQRGGKGTGLAARGRPRSHGEKQGHRPGQRKRAGGQVKRNGSAPKRPRSLRDGNITPSGSMSESGPAESEEEEELDDQSLGIKSNARTLRLSPRRKSSTPPKRPKSKAAARPGSGGEANVKKTGLAAGRPPRSHAGSFAQGGSSSESSSSDSSAVSLSSRESGYVNGARGRKSSRGGRGGKVATVAGSGRDKVKVKSLPKKDDVGVASEKREDKRGDGQGRDMSEQRADGPEEDAEGRSSQPDEASHPKKGKDENLASVVGIASAEVKPTVANVTIKQEPQQGSSQPNASRGWQATGNVRERQGILTGKLDAATAKVSALGANAVEGREQGKSRAGAQVPQAAEATPTKARVDADDAKEGPRDDERSSTEFSTPVTAQESAERKEAQTPDYPNGVRKSPRSKETPSASRLDESIMDVLRAGVPDVAEAKDALSPSKRDPLGLSARAESNNGDAVHGWMQVPTKKLSPQPRSHSSELANGVADIMVDSVKRDGKSNEGKSRQAATGGTTKEAKIMASSPASAPSGEEERPNPRANSPTAGEEVKELSHDTADEKTRASAQSQNERPSPKTSAGKGTSKGKAKGKVKGAKTASAASTSSESVIAPKKAPAAPASAHPTPTWPVRPAFPPEDAANVPMDTPTGEEGKNKVVTMDATSVPEARNAPKVPVKAPSPDIEAAAPLSVPEAMEVEPDQMVIAASIRQIEAAGKWPLSPSKVADDVPEATAPAARTPFTEVGHKSPSKSKTESAARSSGKDKKADPAVSAVEKGERDGLPKPARKRPRSEPAQGAGAKSDWPAPVLSRSGRPGPDSMDVDSSPSAPGEDLIANAGVSPFKTNKGGSVAPYESVPRAEESKPKDGEEETDRNPVEDEPVSEKSLGSATVIFDRPPTLSNGAREDAGPGHPGRDPGGGPNKTEGENGGSGAEHAPAESKSTTPSREVMPKVDGASAKASVPQDEKQKSSIDKAKGQQPGASPREPSAEALPQSGDEPAAVRQLAPNAPSVVTDKSKSKESQPKDEARPAKPREKEKQLSPKKVGRPRNSDKAANSGSTAESASDSSEGRSERKLSNASKSPTRSESGRQRCSVTRFEPSMDPDRLRGQHRPERHERQAAVEATKRLAASAPLRRASSGRGRGHEGGGGGRGRGRGRGGRGGRGRGGRGSAQVVQQPEPESSSEDDDDEEGVDWVQCDNCEKWWQLPSTVSGDDLPDIWHCQMQNWGEPMVDCLTAKEPEGPTKPPPTTPAREEAEGAPLSNPIVATAAISTATATATVASSSAVSAAPAVVLVASASVPTAVVPKALAVMTPAIAPVVAPVAPTVQSKPVVVEDTVAKVAPPAPEKLRTPSPLAPSPTVVPRIDTVPEKTQESAAKEKPDAPAKDQAPERHHAPLPPQYLPPKEQSPKDQRLKIVRDIVPEVATIPRPMPAVALPAPPARSPAPSEAPSNKSVKPGEDKPSGIGQHRKRTRAESVEESSDEDGRNKGDSGAAAAAAAAAVVAATAAGPAPAPEDGRSRAGSGAGRGGNGRGRKKSSGIPRGVMSLVIAAESRIHPRLEKSEVGMMKADSVARAADAAADTAAAVAAAVPAFGPATTTAVTATNAADTSVKAQQWVSCDHKNCGKWRRLPPGVNLEGVDKWYCEMAKWNPDKARCDYPEDSDLLLPTSNNTSLINANYRCRRGNSRVRAPSVARDEASGLAGTWMEGHVADGSAERSSEASSSGQGTGVGRGRGRGRKVEVQWVMCDLCQRWRKLSPGMRSEELPERWYCNMNNWSTANHCGYPDEYDEETNAFNGAYSPAAGGERGHGAAGGASTSVIGAGPGGLLARNSAGTRQKANGRLSYREILFNNDGKLRPPYSAGPSASASAGYLFPKPGDDFAAPAPSQAGTDPVPSRHGFHFSEKYCPVNGPERPPPRQDLLMASVKLTSWITPSHARSGSGANASMPHSHSDSSGSYPSPVSNSEYEGHARHAGGSSSGAGQGWGEAPSARRHDPKGAGIGHGGVGRDRGRVSAHANWTGVNGTRTPAPLPNTEVSRSAAAEVTSEPLPQASRRLGTYEREREERGLVLRYLRAATTSQQSSVDGSDAAGTSASMPAADSSSSVGEGTRVSPESPTSDSEGTTAAALLVAMRDRPWDGRPNAGSPREWREWLEHLEPTLERHLRWLTVDGLAARSMACEGSEQGQRSGVGEARFSAVLPGDGREEVAGTGGQGSVARQARPPAGGRAAPAEAPAAGGVEGPAGAGGGGSCVLTGQMRIMKSRPIKMVKPWR